jgi:hydroxymethylglutaryl-CoA synthase
VSVGIEQIELYEGRLKLDLDALARVRGEDPKYVTDQVMMIERTVFPPFEDSVTLATNAARRLLERVGRDDIELVVMSTESGVDMGKAGAVWVHALTGLPSRCRAFEVKHACYGGVAALRAATAWVASGVRPGKKALVVCADMSLPHLNDRFEYIAGGCGLAMLVSAKPDILELHPEAGCFTRSVDDALRPIPGLELFDAELSMFSYLDALDGAYAHFSEVRPHDLERDFQRHVYHAPFPGMTKQAHRTLMSGRGLDRKRIQASFEERVLPGLSFGRRLGTVYGASNFVSLLGHLAHGTPPSAGEQLSFFAYGSGCVGEFYAGTVGPEGVRAARALELGARLDAREPVSVEEYEALERQRKDVALASEATPWASVPERLRAPFHGRGLVVLKEIKAHRRTYELVP